MRDDQGAKYVNTAETDFFHKSQLLYGVDADAQRRALDRIDAIDLAVEMRRQRGIQLGAMRLDAAHEILEIVEVGDLHVLLVAELVDHARDRVAAELPCIERLQRAAPRARARSRIDAGCVMRLHRRVSRTDDARTSSRVAARFNHSTIEP